MLASSRLDQVGVVASAVCALHCALGPLIVGASGLAGTFAEDARIETTLVLSAILVAVVASAMGYRRHRDPWVIGLVAGGTCWLGMGRFLESPIPEPVFTVAAGGLLIGAHARNALLLHRLRACCTPEGCVAQ